MAKSELISSLKEQAKAVLVMMGVAIISVLAMIVLGFFKDVIHTIPNLGNATGGGVTTNVSVTTALDLFIVAFGITGSFASITVLIIVIKAIIGVVRGLKT